MGTMKVLRGVSHFPVHLLHGFRGEEGSSAEISRKVALVLLPLLSLPGIQHIPLCQLMLVGTDTKQSEFESKRIPSEGAVSRPSLFLSHSLPTAAAGNVVVGVAAKSHSGA